MNTYKDELWLYHHGVKGQRWGVRRYQNEDGSLTRAGQKRYNKNLKRVNKALSKQEKYIEENTKLAKSYREQAEGLRSGKIKNEKWDRLSEKERQENIFKAAYQNERLAKYWEIVAAGQEDYVNSVRALPLAEFTKKGLAAETSAYARYFADESQRTIMDVIGKYDEKMNKEYEKLFGKRAGD